MNEIQNNASNGSEIGLEELRALYAAKAPFAIAEILPPSYYEAGHLPTARHLPLEGFDERARSVLPKTSDLVVVYCASATCPNSDIAARRLGEMGYRRVRVFKDGKAAWTAAGLELERAAA